MSAPRTKFFWIETTVAFFVFAICAALLGYEPTVALPASAVGAFFVWTALQSFGKEKKSCEKKASHVEETVLGSMRDPRSEYSGKEAVARLFLDMFKLRLDAKTSDAAEFEPLDPFAGSKSSRYELRVSVGERWQSRNVTIGELGEFGIGKSRCYHVIYDNQLVVKVPPKTSSSVADYVEGIRRDLAVAERLAPRECLVPSVSIILDKLLPQREAAKFDNENQALEWLLSADKYLPFFKIGDRFVYFMNLARHFFLSGVLDEIHDKTGRFYEEAFRDPDIVLTPYRFEDRYGDEKLGYALHEMYSQFESGADAILAQNRTRSAASVHPFKLRQWFFHFLAGKKMETDREHLPENAVLSLNRLFSNLKKDNSGTVESYRSIVRKTVEKKALSANINQISSICSNVLELLGWLYERRVSIRDLKPENLLLIGPPDDYPEFLKYPGEFHVGLIDVETAVYFGAENDESIPQPLLGGTPLYATPLNFLPNSAIRKYYADLPLMLHLQDWYATIGIVFKVATGECLFKEASGAFPASVEPLETATNQNAISAKAVREIGETFWSRARRELASKLDARKEALAGLEIPVPERTIPVLQMLSLKAAESIEKDLKVLAMDRKLFANKNIQCKIYNSPAEDIPKLGEIWMGTKGANASPESRAHASEIFGNLFRCKRQTERNKSFRSTLEVAPAKITANLLLESLFDMVFVLMHQRVWGVVAETTIDTPTARILPKTVPGKTLKGHA